MKLHPLAGLVLATIAFPVAAFAQAAPATSPKRPLTALPYTPSLDPAVDGPRGRSLRRLLPVLLRRLDEDEPDPARPGALERLRQAGRREPAVPVGDARGGRRGPRRAATRRPAEDRRLLRRLHGRARDREGGRGAARARTSTAIAAPRLARASSPRSWPGCTSRRESSGFLFGFGSNQDFADSTQVIAFADAGGLGLPDRDYYVKDRREVEGDPRAATSRTWPAMLELLGDAARRGARGGGDGDGDRDRAREGLAHPRRAARPVQALPQDEPRRSCRRSRPSFHWDDYLRRARAAGLQDVNVTEPAFFKELERELAGTSLGRPGRPTCAGTSSTRARRISRAPSCDANFDFYSQLPARREGDAAALEALRAAASTATSARRSARCSCARTFPPETQGEDARHDAAHRAGDGAARSTAARLDERRRPRRQRSPSCTACATRSAIPTGGATTRRSQIVARRLPRQRPAGDRRSSRSGSSPRSASRWTAASGA